MAVDEWDAKNNTVVYDDSEFNSTSNEWSRKPSDQKAYKEYKRELEIAEREQQKKLNATKRHLKKEKQIKEELIEKSIERLDNRTNELESWFEERKKNLIIKSNDFLIKVSHFNFQI